VNESVSSSRKLSVIFAADAAGYSRLMAGDESATIAALNEARGVFRRVIGAHGGRVVDTAGDSVLAEFSSPIEAASAAAEIQGELARANAATSADRRMEFRIGINLGDVVDDGGTLYGNGVNVAARLQELAEPGGICISGSVFEQVEDKLPLQFLSIGEQRVKNIAKPIRAYKHVAGPALQRARLAPRSAWIGAGMCAALLTVAGLAWKFWPALDTSMKSDRVYSMPSGPVVAVLPFTNMSGDPQQEYFSDGLTEDIITELARFNDIYVLARNTTAQYKGKAIDVPAVGRGLGAGYVLEGSVRRAGGQLRITAQLIDVATGAHVWAERYDRSSEDIFVVQGDIASRIAAAISGGSRTAISRASSNASSRKDPRDLQAHEHVLKASVYFSTWSKENYEMAKVHLNKAIEIAPEYARARHMYAYALLTGWIFHFEQSPAPPASIIANAVKSVELDPTDYRAHRTAAFGYFFNKDLGSFDRHATQAIELAPNDAEVLAEMGALYTFSGQWDRGVKLSLKAQNLNKLAAAGWYHAALHYDLFRRKHFQESLEVIRAHPQQNILHTQWKYVPLYAELGDLAKAKKHFEICLSFDPAWSADRMREELRLWNFPEPFIETYLASYAKAGYRTTGP